MAEKNGYRGARTGRGTEALTQRKAEVEARKAAEHIYSNLNTFTLGGDEAPSAANVSLMTNAIHIQDSNEQALLTANIINEALFRLDGGPIPATCTIKTVTVVDDTRTTLFLPEAGSVYTVQSITVNWDSKTGDSAIILYQYDAVAGNITQLLWQNNTSTGTVVTTLNADSEFSWPIIVDENCYLQILAGTAANWDSVEFETVSYRVR